MCRKWKDRHCPAADRRTDYTAEELGELTALYRGVLDGDTKVEENRPHTTRGHYFRGVL